MHKLSDNDVRQIRNLVALGTPQKNIALAYGVSAGAVSFVVNRKTWSHVD